MSLPTMEKRNANNPLVSYLLFTYNQEKYVRESVEAALEQNYSPLEIIISDDCSTDRTFDVIQEVISQYEGPHSIRINRNEENLGIGGHVATVASKASGDFFVTVGGDDISIPSHVGIAVSMIAHDEELQLFDFSATTIDMSGAVIGGHDALTAFAEYELSDFLAFRSLATFAPGRIVRRSLFDRFDSIASSCPTEDSVLVLRALLLGKIGRSATRIIEYRRANYSVSTPQNMKSIDIGSIVRQYLTDVDCALSCELITPKTAHALRRRITIDYWRRKLLYRQCLSFAPYLAVRIAAKVLLVTYRIMFRMLKGFN